MTGMNHLLRNMLNHLNLVEISNDFQKDVREGVVQMLKKEAKEIEAILEKLSNLRKLDPHLIQTIAFSNVRGKQKN